MKNMKLTHLSLSVLIALGLVACGGSDNKDNMTIDKDKHGETGGKGGNGGGKPEITPEHTGNIPQRYVPGLNVPDDLKGQVAARKRFAVRRSFADLALGYEVASGAKYDSKLSTNPADIKRTSIYNYVKENDLVVVSADGKRVTGGYNAKAKGAISIGGFSDKTNFNTNDAKLNAWVEGADGKYYRLKSNKAFADYDKDTTFSTLESGAKLAGGIDPTDVPQKAVVFIANANLDSSNKSMELGDKGKYNLGSPQRAQQVILDNVSVFGNDYNPQKLSQNLDLSKLNVDTSKIQVQDISGNYRVVNTKGTGRSDDDTTLYHTALLGKVKVYNLPHSIAFVTTNDKMTGEKNVFNFSGSDGAFQLNGLQTTSLPKDGRALYTGKSFSADVEGNIELTADFFENEAGILGRVYDRKSVSTGTPLDELTLERIGLSSPQSHGTKGMGVVKGAEDYAKNWTVQLYGADAQEAGGFLGNFTPAQYNGTTQTAEEKFDVKEVYTSQRGKLYPKSNDSTTK